MLLLYLYNALGGNNPHIEPIEQPLEEKECHERIAAQQRYEHRQTMIWSFQRNRIQTAKERPCNGDNRYKQRSPEYFSGKCNPVRARYYQHFLVDVLSDKMVRHKPCTM